MKRILFFLSVFILVGCTQAIDIERDRTAVTNILSDLDNLSLTVEQQLDNYSPDAVILAPDQTEIRGYKALRMHLADFGVGADLDIEHQIVELTSFKDIVVVQGRVVGVAKPENDTNEYPFETKNILLFKRNSDGSLRIWKVIYNAAPNDTDV